MERVTRSGNLRNAGMSENSRSKSCLLRTVWRKECGGKTEVAARKRTELLLPQSFIRSKHPSMSVSHILIYCRNPRLKNPSVYTQSDSVVDHWKKKYIYFAACASLCFLCNVLWTGSLITKSDFLFIRLLTMKKKTLNRTAGFWQERLKNLSLLLSLWVIK